MSEKPQIDLVKGYKALSELVGVSVRMLKAMVSKRQIPFTRIGHKTYLFNLAKVQAALDRLETKAA